jgi:peptidoglycan-associated lipoprotein
MILLGCSHPKAVVNPTPAAPPPVATTKTPEPVKQTAVSPNVTVSDDIAKQCRLTFDSVTAAPKFDFDTSELEAQDRDVLDRVATCLTTGPLKGKAVKLVGRADPRGTDEYNLGLGTRRAHAVGMYLERLGVASRQVAETTRGALDAHGTDDGSYRSDRRVDLTLVD